MSFNLPKTKILNYGLMMCLLSGCYHPPYNNFRPYNNAVATTAGGVAVGALAGTLATGNGSGTVIGALVGGGLGFALGATNDSKRHIVKELSKMDIQYVQYGDTNVLIVPTDKYFMINSPRLNQLSYKGLTNIVKLLKIYPRSQIYVAGFTDNVGTSQHKKMMSQAQAETMLTYLWANDIQAQRLKAEGYGDKNDISDNELIHGSAQNRRIEIQWYTNTLAQNQSLSPAMYSK